MLTRILRFLTASAGKGYWMRRCDAFKILRMHPNDPAIGTVNLRNKIEGRRDDERYYE